MDVKANIFTDSALFQQNNARLYFLQSLDNLSTALLCNYYGFFFCIFIQI